MTGPRDLATEHLLLRMRPINRLLRRAAERQAAEAAMLDRADLTPYCIPEEQVQRLLERVDRLDSELGDDTRAELTDAERSAEQSLRVAAHHAGGTLPLDRLEMELELAPAEVSAVLLSVAPELDRGYDRIFAFILDDLGRRLLCPELLYELLAGSAAERIALATTVGPAGALRRFGLLEPWGETPSEARQELRAAPGLVRFLTGSMTDLSLVAHDPGAVPDDPPVAAPPPADPQEVERIGRALRDGLVDLVGVWGPGCGDGPDVVLAIARAARLPIRQVPPLALAGASPGVAVRTALEIASTLGALLWIRVDQVPDAGYRRQVAQVLASTRTPVLLGGADPWWPPAARAGRRYLELVVPSPRYRDRVAMWSSALPALGRPAAEELAARYRLSGVDLRTVAALVEADPRVAGRPTGGELRGAVDRAVAAVTDRSGDGFARPVVPRRQAGDLVLPEAQRRQLAEVSAACLAWPRIAEVWGFGRHAAGAGVKVLFTGEPGTGKTLAAEVVTGTLGLLLLKVDLSRVVSKWVGETEKNLESAFRQAEESQAVLFFDEADALFGKRGDIKQGMDRYANLEVGFLLQRLEQSDAVVILASNLREQVDPAFTRRFHYIVNFPRPGLAERERIWRVAFPPDTPLADDVDLAAMASLDMTGASISGAARTAALLAADGGEPSITMAHVVQAVRRQYDRDARLLNPAELGRFAALADARATTPTGLAGR